MSFQILRATIEDVPDIVRVHDDAMADDPVLGKIFINVEPKLRTQGNIDFFQKKFTQARHMGFEVWKVVEKSSGKLIGLGIWEFPRQLTEAEQEEKAALIEEGKKKAMPEGTNMDLVAQVFGRIEAMKTNYKDPTKDYYMTILCIDPEYQRQGLGGKLLDEGLAFADQDGADCYIIATDKGLGLYLKHGWKPIDEVVVDLAQAKIGEGKLAFKCLKRSPKSP